MRSKTFSIYALYDTRNLAIRYIGVTSRPLYKRINEHLNGDTNRFVKQWIISLRQMEGGNEIEPRNPEAFGHQRLEYGSVTREEEQTWKEAREEIEREWIEKAEAKGHPLLNDLSPKRDLSGPVTFGESLLPAEFRKAMFEEGAAKDVPVRRILRSAVVERLISCVALGSTTICTAADETFDCTKPVRLPLREQKPGPLHQLWDFKSTR